jgi:hypothetical protein
MNRGVPQMRKWLPGDSLAVSGAPHCGPPAPRSEQHCPCSGRCSAQLREQRPWRDLGRARVVDWPVQLPFTQRLHGPQQWWNRSVDVKETPAVVKETPSGAKETAVGGSSAPSAVLRAPVPAVVAIGGRDDRTLACAGTAPE